jgi:uncharacterized coiled-coil protein SlyX
LDCKDQKRNATMTLSYVEFLWETTEKDRKICELEHKIMIQGHALEDQDNMICNRIIEKQEKALEVLTAKIIHLETGDNDNGERLNNHSSCLGYLEMPQPVRESRSNLVYWI